MLLLVLLHLLPESLCLCVVTGIALVVVLDAPERFVLNRELL